jgi:peptidoglycan hydrolase-like protein with peptidoglycan-binding domain
MRLKIISVATGLALLMTAMPTQAAGLTSAQVTAVVSLLQSFDVSSDTIAHVQAVLNGQSRPDEREGHINIPARPDEREGYPSTNTGSTTPKLIPPGQFGKILCIALNRNLGVGSQGDDVKNLQQLLMSDLSSGFTGTPTGFFGPITAKAVMRFQMSHGIASSSTGAIGPMTRGFFERECGKGLDGERGKPPMVGSTTSSTAVLSPMISVTPTTGTSSVTASITVKVQNMNYAVDFGNGSSSWLSRGPNAQSSGECVPDNTGYCTITLTNTYTAPSGLNTKYTIKLLHNGETVTSTSIVVSGN